MERKRPRREGELPTHNAKKRRSDSVSDVGSPQNQAMIQRCMQRYNWTLDYGTCVFEAYWIFLGFKKAIGDWDGTKLAPPLPIDRMWRDALLDTRKYSEDCISEFGRMIHYNPDRNFDAQARKERLERTKTMVKLRFGANGYDQNVWHFGSSDATTMESHSAASSSSSNSNTMFQSSGISSDLGTPTCATPTEDGSRLSSDPDEPPDSAQTAAQASLPQGSVHVSSHSVSTGTSSKPSSRDLQPSIGTVSPEQEDASFTAPTIADQSPSSAGSRSPPAKASGTQPKSTESARSSATQIGRADSHLRLSHATVNPESSPTADAHGASTSEYLPSANSDAQLSKAKAKPIAAPKPMVAPTKKPASAALGKPDMARAKVTGAESSRASPSSAQASLDYSTMCITSNASTSKDRHLANDSAEDRCPPAAARSKPDFLKTSGDATSTETALSPATKPVSERNVRTKTCVIVQPNRVADSQPRLTACHYSPSIGAGVPQAGPPQPSDAAHDSRPTTPAGTTHGTTGANVRLSTTRGEANQDAANGPSRAGSTIPRPSAAPAQTTNVTSDSPSLHISIYKMQRPCMTLKVYKSTTLRKIFATYERKMGFRDSTVAFYLNGRVLEKDVTVKMAGIVDGSRIRAMGGKRVS